MLLSILEILLTTQFSLSRIPSLCLSLVSELQHLFVVMHAFSRPKSKQDIKFSYKRGFDGCPGVIEYADCEYDANNI